MITPELVSYIKQQLAQGLTRDMIATTLVTNGWGVADINEGFQAAGLPPVAIPTTNSMPVNIQNRTMTSNGTNNKSSTIFIVVTTVLVMVVIGGFLVYFFGNKDSASLSSIETLDNKFVENTQEEIFVNTNEKLLSPSEQFMASSRNFDNVKSFEGVVEHVKEFGAEEVVSQLQYMNGTADEMYQIYQLTRAVAPYSYEITIKGESINGNTATVNAYAKSTDGKKSGNGIVEMRLENGIWKIYRESWEGWKFTLE